MGESRVIVEELLSLCLQRINMEESNVNIELEFLEVLKSFESVRKRWLLAEVELKKYKELLVKSDVSKAALEVKLKHARNQLDVEMKKRYKVEADYQHLQRQMQLICDILVHDSKSSACLNEEQKSLLATFDHKGSNLTMQRSTKRLSVIDESSFLSHSDISYDCTENELDLDTTIIKPLRSRVRERRRSSMGPVGSGPVSKRGRGNMSTEVLERKTVDKEVETVVKASVISAKSGSQIHMVVGITQETSETPDQTTTQETSDKLGKMAVTSVGAGDQTSVWLQGDDTIVELEPEPLVELIPLKKALRHVFLSKTVIRPETCTLCSKRIRFGKMAVKCRNCRMVAHPECKQKITNDCSPSSTTTGSATQNWLEGFAPPTHPRIPQLVVDCVAEIERRGLLEKGLYRVPGSERLVKELRERFLQGKPALLLSKIHDIHVVCGLLKDFLRRLKEPLITFKLHQTFMEASLLPNEDNSSTILCQAIADLPKANRDTLAFLMLHLHKVMRSPQCQMDQNNLARVFGPTIVGHGMSEPSPSTIMRDTNTQPKVVGCLLSLPEDYWRRILAGRMDQTPTSSSSNRVGHNQSQGRFFKPLMSPELNSCKIPGEGSLKGQTGNQGTSG
ncbi:rac GTPase-activating protein 1 [Pholidichthys leucotaenia]